MEGAVFPEGVLFGGVVFRGGGAWTRRGGISHAMAMEMATEMAIHIVITRGYVKGGPVTLLL